MHFDMNRAWSQAIALVKANWQLLALIAGIFMLLPSLAFIVLMPEVLMLPGGGDPEIIAGELSENIGRMAGALLIIILASLVGYAAMIALMGRERPTVGGAIAQGLKALPTLIGAFVLFVIGYLLLAFALGLIAAVLAFVLGAETAGMLGAVVTIVLILYILARVSLTTPVVVLENVRNPWRALVRSWRLTARDPWRILGFFALLLVVYLVLSLLLVALMSALGLAVEPSGGVLLLFGIVSGMLGMAVSMVFSGILVSMHKQLSDGGESAAAAA